MGGFNSLDVETDVWDSIGFWFSNDVFDFLWIDWTGRMTEVPSTNQQNNQLHHFNFLIFHFNAKDTCE